MIKFATKHICPRTGVKSLEEFDEAFIQLYVNTIGFPIILGFNYAALLGTHFWVGSVKYHTEGFFFQRYVYDQAAERQFDIQSPASLSSLLGVSMSIADVSNPILLHSDCIDEGGPVILIYRAGAKRSFGLPLFDKFDPIWKLNHEAVAAIYQWLETNETVSGLDLNNILRTGNGTHT